MFNKIFLICLGLMLLFTPVAYAQGATAADVLFEAGKKYYEQGDYEQALHELRKTLLVEPQHAQAIMYIQLIEEGVGLPDDLYLHPVGVSRVEEGIIEISAEELREEAMILALEEAEMKMAIEPEIVEPVIEEEIVVTEGLRRNIILATLDKFDELIEEVNEAIAPVKVSGEYRLAMGISSEDLTGKFADAGLAERNWRYMAPEQKRFNSFDPAIYNRFKLNVETDTEGPLDACLSLVVDPWSFRGTTRKVNLEGTWPDGDVVEDVQLKYFSGNRRTINETYRTIRGDSLGINEMKVIDDWTTAETRNAFSWGNWQAPNTYLIPALEIDREFMPIRKLSFDIGELSEEDEQGIHLRIFPWAGEEQALTTDDPLMLSNRHNYWEPSPWIWDWEQHEVFTANNALKPGRWSDTLAFRARDTEGYRLTYLRGVSLEAKGEKASFQTTVGFPLSPWDDYQVVNNIPGAVRVKVFPQEELMLGSTYTFRTGFAGGHKDVSSHTVAVDTEIKVTPEISLKAEAALSKSKADQTSEAQQWQNEDTGQACKAELSYTSDEENSFDSLQVKVAGTYMGKDFSAPLSHYLETRDDMFWGKHISFLEPIPAYEPFRIGDGIDTDRYAGELDLRAKLFEERLALLFNLRNIHRASNDKYIETVFRNEGTYKVNPKLTAKWLLINRDLPETVANYDPLIVKADGEPFLNYAIQDGLDPSTLTGALGLKCDFTDNVSLEGIYERSNDLPDFPRGLLNDTAYIGTKTEGGITYDVEGSQLYQQGIFPLPPYDYFNVYKVKLTLKPSEDLTLRLNYTRNSFKYAGPVDDNINHRALEVDYGLGEKWGFSFRYVYSKFIDVYLQSIGEGIHYDGHHNFYAEARYDIDDNKRLRVQYGTFGYFNPAAGEYSTSWSLATVDTEHLVRIFVSGKF